MTSSFISSHVGAADGGVTDLSMNASRQYENGRSSVATSSSSLSFPVTTTSSQDDFLSLERSSSKSRLLRILVFGLLLYLLDVGLHITIASHYLDMKNCHRGITHSFEPFTLGDMLDINSTLANVESERETSENPVKELLNDQLYLKVRKKLISLIPEHWEQKIVNMVSFHMSNYKPSQIAHLCELNDQEFDNVVELGTFVCKNALTPQQRNLINEAFSDMTPEQEDRLVTALISNNLDALLEIVPETLGVEVPTEGIKVVKRLTEALTTEELNAIMEIMQDPKVAENLLPMMEAMGKIKQKDLDILGEAFSTVDKENIPKIDALLTRLNVSFTSFLTDPSLFAEFLRDPQLTAVLLEVQGLLPNFEPTVLNSILELKEVFDSTPGAGVVLEKVFELPLGVMLKMMSVRLSPEDV